MKTHTMMVAAVLVLACLGCSPPPQPVSVEHATALEQPAQVQPEAIGQPSSSDLAANAVSGHEVFMTGTLAPVNSFEWKAAPAYTHVAVLRIQAADALRKHVITPDEAQALQVSADQVRGELDAAVKVCAQDNKSGRCTGKTAVANSLLRRATADLAKFK